MTTKNWTLIDAETDRDVGDFSVGPADVPGVDGEWSVRKRTLHGGRRAGVTVVEIDNGAFRFTVIPTRGMGIWKAWMRGEML
ncbi:MAG: DUF4432 domain-containing protein, partial [Planctomycetes bacterium]|nr:DUF4432 domain-containing protein [Planctomycetota bacterium]